jgi:hypothetical protein
MLALTPTENLVMNVTSMNKERSGGELVICPLPSGPYFFQNIIPVSSIGQRSRSTKHALTATSTLNRTRQVAP